MGKTRKHGIIKLFISILHAKRSSEYCSSASVGIDLSYRSVTRQVLSALVSLTAVFGMGTGGPSLSLTPTILFFSHPSLRW